MMCSSMGLKAREKVGTLTPRLASQRRTPCKGKCTMTRSTGSRTGWTLLSLTALAGCGQLLGLGDFEDAPAGAASGTGGGTATSTTSTSSGGAGGGETTCEPGTTRACYGAPAETEGVGVCAAGTEACKADGSGYDDCEGEIVPGTEDCAQPADEDCSGMACSEPVWSHIYGDAQTQFVTGLAVDASGNVITAGFFEGAINFGTDSSTTLIATKEDDFFLAKLSSAGDLIWSKRFGDDTNELFPIVAVDKNGNIFWGGLYKNMIHLGDPQPLLSVGHSDFFLAKFDPMGNHVWSRTFGDDSIVQQNAIVASADGDVVMTGVFDGTISFDGDSYTSAAKDVFVVKLDGSDGSVLWSRSYGDVAGQPANDQSPSGIAIDNSGSVVVAGNFVGTVDIGPGSGSTELTADGGVDIFAFRLDANGNRSWGVQFGGSGDEIATGVAVDGSGSVAIAGFFAGSTTFAGFTLGGPTKSTSGPTDSDVFLTKLTSVGGHAWTQQFGDDTPQVQFPLPSANLLGGVLPAFDAQGNVLISGGFEGTVNFGSEDLSGTAGSADAFLAKFDSAGAPLWSKTFGDAAAFQVGIALATDLVTRDVLIALVNDGTMSFGNSQLTSAGSTDVVLAKIAP